MIAHDNHFFLASRHCSVHVLYSFVDTAGQSIDDRVHLGALELVDCDPITVLRLASSLEFVRLHDFEAIVAEIIQDKKGELLFAGRG